MTGLRERRAARWIAKLEVHGFEAERAGTGLLVCGWYQTRNWLTPQRRPWRFVMVEANGRIRPGLHLVRLIGDDHLVLFERKLRVQRGTAQVAAFVPPRPGAF